MKTKIYIINENNYKVKYITYKQYVNLTGWYNSNEAISFLKRLKERLIKDPNIYNKVQYKISIERGIITMIGFNLSNENTAQEIVDKLISLKGKNYLNWIEPYI